MFSKRTNWNLEKNAYARAVERHRESGRALLDLTISNPTACGFEYDETTILAALRSPVALRYDPQPKGLLSARQAVVNYYRQQNPSAATDAEHLVLTTGTSEAYSFLFRLLCESGDEMIVAHPSYPLFDFLATIEDVTLRPFRLIYDHGWQFDFAVLRQAIGPRTRAILLVHPNNPTGHFISCEEAAQLRDIAEHHHLALVVDEVFLDYPLPGSEHRKRHGSFVGDSRALTFVLSGLSKTAALPQMKVAWIAAHGPDALVREALARLELIADTYLSMNAPLQLALPKLLAQRSAIQSQIISRIEANLRELDDQLSRQESISRLKIEGGWYAVLRVPALESDEELAVRLLEEYSVLVHPGHFYEFIDDGYFVISLIPPEEEFAKGAEKLIEGIPQK